MSNEINKKFAKAKEKLKEVTKDSKNPFYKSNYADLNTHLDLINPVLSEVGLDMRQPVTATLPGNGEVSTILVDKETGDEKVMSVMPLPQIADPQKILACITYFRRGALNALFNLKSVDDDGETAAGRGKNEAKKAPTATTTVSTASTKLDTKSSFSSNGKAF